MLNGPFIGGGHGVWRPILVCLPPHRVHSCRARPCRMNRTNLTKKREDQSFKMTVARRREHTGGVMGLFKNPLGTPTIAPFRAQFFPFQPV